MEERHVLADLRPGQAARVTALDPRGELTARLAELGFLPGTRVVCVARAPLGDPTAYLVRGAVIALRDEDASGIRVTAEEGRPVAALAGWD